MVSAPAFAQRSGYFAANDTELVKTGVPSRVFSKQNNQTDRYLQNNVQKERSLANLGISRFCLDGCLDVDAYGGSLADSADGGRVVPVDGLAINALNFAGAQGERKRTPLPIHWLSSEGKSTDIEIGEDAEQKHYSEEEIARALDIARTSGHQDPEKVLDVVQRQLLKGRDEGK